MSFLPFGLFWIVNGFRYGEALHPGPTHDCITLAAINPTTLLHKVPDLVELGANVIVASETAATRAVQCTVTRQMPARHFVSHWGPPVLIGLVFLPDVLVYVGRPWALPSSLISPAGDLLTRSPTSCPAVAEVSESFIRLANFEFRMIALYGILECLPEASLRNNLLLSWAYQRATGVRVPALYRTLSLRLKAFQHGRLSSAWVGLSFTSMLLKRYS